MKPAIWPWLAINVFAAFVAQAASAETALTVAPPSSTSTSTTAPIATQTIAQAQALPRESRVPGGIALIDLGARSAQPPQVYLGTHRAAVMAQGERWIAVVGLGLTQAAGSAELRIVEADRERRLPLVIENKSYTVQKLSVAPQFVNPPPEVNARIEREQAETTALFNSFTPGLPDFRFLKPARGATTNSFGSRREFNGEARNPHSGMDIPGDTGEPVIASAAGRVVLAKDLYFNGNTVIVDHGSGVLTLYCHLDRISVEKGSDIAAGAELGRLGASGRVTGPHLHWSVSVSGARVDPALFLVSPP